MRAQVLNMLWISRIHFILNPKVLPALSASKYKGKGIELHACSIELPVSHEKTRRRKQISVIVLQVNMHQDN